MQYLSIAAVSIALGIALACTEPPPSTDAGSDPEISNCCDWYILPGYYDRPQVCLDKHTDLAELEPGQCRWLRCLGGLVTYKTCRPE